MNDIEGYFEFEQFIEAVEDYIEAKKTEREARERYQGYSWGWAGRFEIEIKEEKAKIAFNYFKKLMNKASD